MFTFFKQSWQLTIVAVLAATMLFVGVAIFSPTVASAQTDQINNLMALIAKLQDQLKELQAKSTTSVSAVGVGSTIVTTDTVRVRSVAGTIIPSAYTQPAGKSGKITEGPRAANGHTWYKVDFETGADGWVAGSWIRLRTELPKPTGLPVPSPVTCMDGKEEYAEGAKRTSLINTDGTTTSIMDAYFVCRIKDGKGVWVREGSLPKPTGLPDSTEITCLNGKVQYREGTKRTSLINADGTTTSIMDAYFVCRSENGIGVWVREGSLPKPTGLPDPAPITCMNGKESYPEGTKRTSLINADGTTTSIMDAYFVCRSKDGKTGTWVREGSMPKPTEPVTKITCTNAGVIYEEGAKRNSLTINGTVTVIYDAYFVCRSSNDGKTGAWVKEGSLPPTKIMCTNGTETYPEGTKHTSLINADGTTTSIMDAYFVCRSKDGKTGTWVREGSMPKPVVKGASTDMLAQISASLVTLSQLLEGLE